MNRSRYPGVYVAGGAVLLVVCLGMVCQVKSCAKRLTNAARGAAGLPGILSLLPTSGQTEPQKPNVVPPGTSALPSASRRPVFGRPMDEGTDVTIAPTNTDEHGRTPTDTVKLRVRKDGSVQSIGKDTVVMTVRRYGPPWIEWDPSVGICAFGSKDRSDWMPVARQGGYALDVGGKLKLLDFRPLHGVQIGIPTLYATTACFGVGCDLKITGMEWIAIDGAYFPFVKRAAVGISVNLP